MPTRIDRIQVERLAREEKALLVEVLSAPDFEKLHLPDAINIPLDNLDRASTERFERGRHVIVYCYDYQ